MGLSVRVVSSGGEGGYARKINAQKGCACRWSCRRSLQALICRIVLQVWSSVLVGPVGRGVLKSSSAYS